VETALATARTAAERDQLRDDLLAQLPWDTPDGEMDWAFASQAAEAPGGLAVQVTCWLRRVQVPMAGTLLAAAVLQALTCG
jgi:hypothetical protein